MKADRDEYKAWKGAPNIPYKPSKHKYTLGQLLHDIVPAFIVGFMLAGAYAALLAK